VVTKAIGGSSLTSRNAKSRPCSNGRGAFGEFEGALDDLQVVEREFQPLVAERGLDALPGLGAFGLALKASNGVARLRE